MYVPSKAAIPDEVLIVCERNQIVAGNTVDVRIASAYQKTPPRDVMFRLQNEFRGPFVLEKIVGTNSGYGAKLIVEDLFPMKHSKVFARCWLPDWSVNDLVFSGLVGKGGVIENNVIMKAVTYGGHYTLVVEGSTPYNSIPKISS